ncbi:MAG: ASCH domain-containing protein [Anaerolineaceae bacterium]|nr:ASCH domain-containing protein [Anaerolineaceae bacterium]
MKALSVKQPLAGLIIAGIKNVENRSWQTKYDGQLVIVSTKKPNDEKYWQPLRDKCKKLCVEFPEELCSINASALGVVDLSNTVEQTNSVLKTVRYRTGKVDRWTISDWWNMDAVGFILTKPRRLLHPIHVVGKLGLYDLPADVAENIEKQLQIFSPTL